MEFCEFHDFHDSGVDYLHFNDFRDSGGNYMNFMIFVIMALSNLILMTFLDSG